MSITTNAKDLSACFVVMAGSIANFNSLRSIEDIGKGSSFSKTVTSSLSMPVKYLSSAATFVLGG